jgi:hypothetical protein
MDLFKLFEPKPDHPMATASGARDALLPLKTEKPLDAAAQLAHWAGTLRDADGFACDDRLIAVRIVDDFARPIIGKLLKNCLAHLHVRDREQKKTIDVLYSYWINLSGAYGRCVSDNEHGERGAERMHDALSLAAARSCRAAGEAARTRSLAYLGIPTPIWANLYHPFAFIEVAHLDDHQVVIYPHEVHTTPRGELLKALCMALCAADELPAEQIELAWRILHRFTVSFSWSRTPQPDCNFIIDLSAGGPPYTPREQEPAAPAKRYFGAGQALAKMEEIENLSDADLLSEDLRFGPEYTPAQIVSVIRHLRNYLGTTPPRRHYARSVANVALSVVRGYRPICQRVTAIDAGAKVDDDLQVEAQKKARLQLTAEDIESTPETWNEKDRSDWGMGVELPAGQGKWAEPGVLVGLRESEAAPWWVGAIRRLSTDEHGLCHCGIQVLSKKPMSVWLRVIGKAGAEASNWESSTGSFTYEYLRAVLLPDALKSHDHPVMLLEPNSFVPGQICELMVGDRTRLIRLAEFIEQGSDYTRVAFAWENAAPKAKP